MTAMRVPVSVKAVQTDATVAHTRYDDTTRRIGDGCQVNVVAS